MKKCFSFLIAISIFLSACGSQEPTATYEPTQPPSSQPQVSSVIESSSAPSVASESSSEVHSSEISSVPDADNPVGIKGSHITDIRLGLSSSIPEGSIKRAPEEAQSVFCFSSTSSGQNSRGCAIDYSLTANKDYEVIGGSFGIENSPSLSAEAFQADAVSYLSFCATMPFDAALPAEEMKAWVADSIAASVPEDGVKKIVGDSSWTLSCAQSNGFIGSYWLEVAVVSETLDGEGSSDASDEEFWGFD